MDPIQQGSSDHVSPKDRRVKGIASQSLSVFMLHLMNGFMVLTGCYSQTKIMRLDLFHLT